MDDHDHNAMDDWRQQQAFGGDSSGLRIQQRLYAQRLPQGTDLVPLPNAMESMTATRFKSWLESFALHLTGHRLYPSFVLTVIATDNNYPAFLFLFVICLSGDGAHALGRVISLVEGWTYRHGDTYHRQIHVSRTRREACIFFDARQQQQQRQNDDSDNCMTHRRHWRYCRWKTFGCRCHCALVSQRQWHRGRT
ncbi:hypothetical protein BDZ89DRAFT_383034 [Hymenopellis radicata]|nr:hypothetical protein BDZ89DRAFT_383034 [Hymenopellis radicata]